MCDADAAYDYLLVGLRQKSELPPTYVDAECHVDRLREFQNAAYILAPPRRVVWELPVEGFVHARDRIEEVADDSKRACCTSGLAGEEPEAEEG